MAQIEYDILTRRDTAADWTSINPTLGIAELGYESDTGRYKTGDGATPWNSLDYGILTEADLGIRVPPLVAGKIPGGYIDAVGDASTLAFTPYQTIAATNVQGAIEEFYDEMPDLAGGLFEMTGIVSGGEVTLNVDATKIDISPCNYFIQGVYYQYAGATAVVPAFGIGQSARRLGLDASGLVEQQGNFSDVQKRTIMPIARLQAVQGNTGVGSPLIAPVDLRYLFGEFGYIDRIWREGVFGALYTEGGGEYSESSIPLQIDQAVGSFFTAQGTKQVIPATVNITAKYVYHVAGAWSVQPDTTLVVNTTQYDNGTDLATIPDNYWVSHTLLRSPKAQNEFFVIVDPTTHTTQTGAEAEAPNYGPFGTESSSGLIAVAKLVVRKGSSYVNRIVNIQPRLKWNFLEGSGVSALLPSVSNPTQVVNYEDAFRIFNSGTIAYGCEATDNGNGTFNIAAGEVILRSSADDDSPMAVYAIDAAGPLTPADNDVTYFFIDYNNGSPVWSSGNSIASYNGMDKMQAFTVSRRGTSLWIIDARGQSIDGNRKSRRRDLEWSGNTQSGFWHTSGGTVIGGVNLNLTLTSGKFYYGLGPVTHPAFDTSVAGTANTNVFDYYYNRGAYTYTANSKTINNTQYDNAGVLTAMAPGRYRSDWVYLVLDGATPRLIVILGNTEYTTLAAAQADPIPATTPAFIQGSSVLVGRVSVLNGATTLTTATAFGSAFNQATSSVHNNLSGINGGSSNEYFHLTSAEYVGTGTGAFVRTTSPTIATPTFTGSATVNANTASAALSVTQLGAGDLFEIKDEDPDTTPFKIDADGRVLVGTTLASGSSKIQAVNDTTGNILQGYHSADANTGASLITVKTRGTSSAKTIVQNADNLMQLVAYGHDGTNALQAATMRVFVDGVPGTNVMPGRFEFSTTPDGSSSPSRRFSLTSAGKGVFSSSSGALTFGQSNIPTVQVNTIDANGIGVSRWTANTAGSFLQLAKSRGSSIASRAVVSSGDTLGTVTFDADDGTNFITGAQILAQVDGTPGTNDMPGRLVFSTTADGTSSPTERYRITSDGKHTYAGYAALTNATNNAAFTITNTGTGNSFVVEDSASTDSTPFVVDASGLVLAGLSNAIDSNRFQISGSGQSIFTYVANQFTYSISFKKSRSATAGAFSALSSGDDLGEVRFFGDDGAAFIQGASIKSQVDGTPGTNDMPGRLVFSTTADGASTPTEALRIDSKQNVGIGSTTPTGYKLRVEGTGDGSASYHIIRAGGTFAQTASTYAACFLSAVDVEDAVWTLPTLDHFVANQAAFGAATVTNQFGFKVQSSLTGATNNYGFYSNIAAATGRWNFYAAGTAANYFAGDVQIGNSAAITGLYGGTSQKLHITGATGIAQSLFANTAVGHRYDFIKSRSATVGAHTIVQSGDNLGGLYWGGSDGATFVPAAYFTAVVDGTPGTNDMPGRLVFATTADGASSPTERMRIDSAGRVGIGATPAASTTLMISKTPTGNVNQYGIYCDGVFQSDVTATGSYYTTSASTAASAFTLTNLIHYQSTQAAIGAGSFVTNQIGFSAGGSLVGATNNYGFYGNIAAGTGRWNFYAAGTAANYFAGALTTGDEITCAKAGSDTVGSGASFVFSSGPARLQLNASGGIDAWTYSSGWFKSVTIAPSGLSVSGTLNVSQSRAASITSFIGEPTIGSTGVAGDTNQIILRVANTLGGNTAGVAVRAVLAGAGSNSTNLVLLGDNGAGVLVDRLTLDSSNRLLLRDGVALGNVSYTDGVGVKFPATQVASSDANTLDDYEEGTFTPAIEFGGATTGITYASQSGRYTKIGNRVSFSLYVALSNKGTAAGEFKVTGLPFAASGSELCSVPVFISAANTTTPNSHIQGYVANGTSTVIIRSLISGTSAALTEGMFLNTTNIAIAGVYHV